MVLKEGMGRLKKPLAFSIEGEWLTEQVGLWIERAVRVVRKRGCGDRQNQTPNSQSVPRVCVCTRACLTACTIPSETGCSCSRRVPEKKKKEGEVKQKTDDEAPCWFSVRGTAAHSRTPWQQSQQHVQRGTGRPLCRRGDGEVGGGKKVGQGMMGDDGWRCHVLHVLSH